MRVSAKSDYALRALIEMASRSDGKAVSAEELGKQQEIPHGFLQAILADLRRAGIVMSQRSLPTRTPGSPTDRQAAFAGRGERPGARHETRLVLRRRAVG